MTIADPQLRMGIGLIFLCPPNVGNEDQDLLLNIFLVFAFEFSVCIA